MTAFSLEDIDFVYVCVEEIWDNSPNVTDLPTNATRWRRSGDVISKSSGQTTVAVNVTTRTVEIRPTTSETDTPTRDSDSGL